MSKWIFALVGLAISCFAQGSLDSANWKDRAAAFRSITAVTAQDQQRIIALLDRENRVVTDALTASGGKRGVSTTLGEEYSEYYSTVLSKVAEFATSGNDAAVPTLAGGAYYYTLYIDGKSISTKKMVRIQ